MAALRLDLGLLRSNPKFFAFRLLYQDMSQTVLSLFFV